MLALLAGAALSAEPEIYLDPGTEVVVLADEAGVWVQLHSGAEVGALWAASERWVGRVRARGTFGSAFQAQSVGGELRAGGSGIRRWDGWWSEHGVDLRYDAWGGPRFPDYELPDAFGIALPNRAVWDVPLAVDLLGAVEPAWVFADGRSRPWPVHELRVRGGIVLPTGEETAVEVAWRWWWNAAGVQWGLSFRTGQRHGPDAIAPD